MYSVRRRLMFVLAVGFAVLIAGASVYGEKLLTEQVTEEFDAGLLARARALMTLTEQEGDGTVQLDYEPVYNPEFEREDDPSYFEYWLDDGRPLYQSSQLRKHEKHLPRIASLATEHRVRDAKLPDGRMGRIVQFAFVPRREGTPLNAPLKDPSRIDTTKGERAMILAVARGRGPLDALIGRIRMAIVIVGVIATLLAAVFVWSAVAAGFKPVESIAKQVRRLDADSLHTRVALVETPREVAPIVDQLNGLLDRLDDSFARERRFTGNVAHELRTPIAELRTLAEVGKKWPEDTASVVGFFEDVNDVAGRMETVISDLLLLARCEAGVERVERTPTSVPQIISLTWGRLAQRAKKLGLQFRLDLPEDLVVDSDEGKLGIVLDNVLGNAVSYARPNSEIRCTGSKGDSSFQLEITNAADPISPEDLDKLAEPFWRKDTSRSAADHAGLGLSVVSALAALLRLDVGFDQDRDGTFRVRLEGSAS